MPPTHQRHNDLELEDLRMQVQQLQETVNAQQSLLDGYQQEYEVDTSSSESSRNDDIRVEITDFEGKL
jgi:small-conductance mechanosensitive channel